MRAAQRRMGGRVSLLYALSSVLSSACAPSSPRSDVALEDVQFVDASDFGMIETSSLDTMDSLVAETNATEAGIDASAESTVSNDANTDAALDVATDNALETSAPDVADPVPPGPATTRLIAPLSGRYTTLRRPTFRWNLAPDVVQAELEFARDRSFTTDRRVQMAPAGARRLVAAAPFEAGVWFWRMHPLNTAGMRGTPTATWSFDVSRAAGNAEHSNIHMLDVNGDGLADLVTGVNETMSRAGKALVHHGRRGMLPAATPTVELLGGIAGAAFGTSVANAGDLNGDGYSDVVIGAPGNVENAATVGEPGRAYVFYGGPSGLSMSASVRLDGERRFGRSASAVGDVNGDGYADLVVSNYEALDRAMPPSFARLYLGSAMGIVASEAIQMPTTGVVRSFGVTGYVGDLNGDGFDDIVLGNDIESFNSGVALLYFGRSRWMTTVMPDLTLRPVRPFSMIRFAYSFVPLGDFNEDGFADFAVSSPSYRNDAGTLYVFRGRGGSVGPEEVGNVYSTATAPTQFGRHAACAGDVNGDGFLDLAAAEVQNDRVHVYPGGPSGPAARPLIVLQRPPEWSPATYFGYSMGGAGDVNGDGYADLYLSGPDVQPMDRVDNLPVRSGASALFLGSASGPAATPAFQLRGMLGDGLGSALAFVRRLSGGDCVL